MKKIMSLAGIAGVGVAALLLAGCASGAVDGSEAPAETDDAGTTELEQVTYGLFPSNTVAALQVAIDKGIFEDHGFDLELVVGAGSSAAQLPALASGELDFMLASPVTALTAATQGLDVRIISGITQNDPEEVLDSTAVVVGADSDITRPSDLAGKTVSVNALGSVGEIGIRESVALDGGDPSAINFVQLSFPEVAAQIEAGQIDAGMAGSPFIQQVMGAGGDIVSDFIHDTGLGKNELITMTSGNLIADAPEKVESFVAALNEALDYMEENTDEIIAAMPEVLGTDPEAAKQAKLSIYNGSLSEETIQLFGDLMFKYEIVDSQPDAAAVIWQP